MSFSYKLPVLTSETGYNNYLKEISNAPSLTAEEEYILAKRIADFKDIEAAHKLVVSHLKLVVKIALGYKGYGLPMADLISEGSLGLMQAVKKFNPELGFRLSTYAIWWIKASIQEYILKTWSLVKIGTTSTQKKLFFNLKRLKNKLLSNEDRELRLEEYKKIADELNIQSKDVEEMDRRFKSDFSLNNLVSGEQETEFLELLPETKPNQELVVSRSQEYSQRKQFLQKAMLSLNDRERDIITQRRLSETPSTLENLSEKYEISPERIRQIEVKALEKMKKLAESDL